MKLKEEWKTILFIGIIASFVFALLLTNLLFRMDILATSLTIALIVHASMFVLVGFILTFNLCLDNKRNKLFKTVISSILFSIILLVIVAIVTNKIDPFIYSLLGLAIMAPAIIFIFGVFGVFIYYTSKFSERVDKFLSGIYQKFRRY